MTSWGIYRAKSAGVYLMGAGVYGGGGLISALLYPIAPFFLFAGVIGVLIGVGYLVLALLAAIHPKRFGVKEYERPE